MDELISKPKNTFLINIFHAIKYFVICFVATNIYWSFAIAFVLGYAFLDKFPSVAGTVWLVAAILLIGYILFLYFFVSVLDFFLKKIFKLQPRVGLKKTMLLSFLILNIVFATIAVISMNTTNYSDIEIQISPIK